MAVPVVQTPIGNVCTLELAAAVANAGGLGMIPIGSYELPEISKVLARLSGMTSGPVGLTLNIRRDQSERLRACLDGGARIVHLSPDEGSRGGVARGSRLSPQNVQRSRDQRYAARQHFAPGVGNQDVVFEPDPAEIQQRVHAVPVDCISVFGACRLVSE